jgi:autotransporter-associated beta strand protein
VSQKSLGANTTPRYGVSTGRRRPSAEAYLTGSPGKSRFMRRHLRRDCGGRFSLAREGAPKRAAVALCSAVAALTVTAHYASGQATFLYNFGSAGSGDGQFGATGLGGITVDQADGLIYVADGGNNRVEMFSTSGVYQSSFNGLSRPGDVSYDPVTQELAILDTGNARVVVDQPGGDLVAVFGSFGTGQGQFANPEGINFSAGVITVADSGNNRIQTFNSVGDYVLSVTGSFNNPQGVAQYPGTDSAPPVLYIADSNNNVVDSYIPNQQNNGYVFASSIGSSGPNAFQFPERIAVTDANVLYVADRENSRVAVITNGATFNAPIGAAGSGAGQLSSPAGVAATDNGFVYVTDAGNSRVDVYFDATGWTFGSNSFANFALGPTSVYVGGGAPSGAISLGTSFTLNTGMNLTVGNTTTVTSSGTLTLDGAGLTTGLLSSTDGTGSIVFAAGGTPLVINGANGVASYAGAITGNGGVSKSGGSTQVFTGSLTYTGATTINAGTLVLGDSGATSPSTSGFIVNAGGTLQLGVAAGNNNVLGTTSAAPAITVNAGGVVTTQADTAHNIFGLTLAGGTMSGNPVPLPGYGDYVLNNTVAVNAASVSSTISAPGGVDLRGNISFNVSSGVGELIVSAVLRDEPGFHGGFTSSGSGTTVLSGANTYTGNTAVNSGAVVLNSAASLPNTGVSIGAAGRLEFSQGIGGVTIQSLSITPGGTLDLKNNHLFIDYGSSDPIATIAGYLDAGYNGGSWTGTGITSSVAAANAASYGLGYADSADPGNPAGLSSGTIEVAYTLLGDANLSGVVDGTDFGIVAANFNKGVTGWDQGDFNYDNVVDGTDFGDLASNFNKGASGAAAVAALDAFAAAHGLLADVPEPASVGCLVLLAGGMLGRRRRAVL